MKGPALQGTAAAAYLEEMYADANALRLNFGTLFDNITWGLRETHDLAEQQIKLLGHHLGFASTRPDKEEKDGGPDNLWGMNPTTNAVIELKTEVNRGDLRIAKIKEAGQLLTSLEWDARRNPHVTQRIPVMLHPSNELHPEANLPPETRIITMADLDKLRSDVLLFADEIAAAKSWGDPAAVTEALHRNKLTADQIIPAHSSKLIRPTSR